MREVFIGALKGLAFAGLLVAFVLLAGCGTLGASFAKAATCTPAVAQSAANIVARVEAGGPTWFDDFASAVNALGAVDCIVQAFTSPATAMRAGALDAATVERRYVALRFLQERKRWLVALGAK